jgi:glutamyl-tRNA reductase
MPSGLCLDSLVQGEAQILGQVNAAGTTAAANGTAGPILKTLFQTAVRTGKRARAETAIGQNPASISSIAITLAQEIAGDLRQRNVLVVGLGKMGQLALKALQVRRIHQVSLANRTRSRAEAVAGQWGYGVYDLTNLREAITHADVVISAVETEGRLINIQQIAEIMPIREGRALVLVDLSMPRTVDTTAKQIPNVHLVDLDDLRGNLDDALAARQREVPAVEAIVEQAVEAFTSNVEALIVEPLISSLRQRAEAIRQEELARVLHDLGDVDDVTFNQIQHLSRSLVNKLLHEPTVRLRQRAGEAQTREYAAVVRDLFALEAEG